MNKTIFGALVALTLCACDRNPAQTQNPRSGPALKAALHPVGPTPGVGETPHQPNPLAGDAQARVDGRRLFNQFNCAGCHGDHGGGGMGPSLRDQDWIYGGEDDDIFDSIAQGRAHGMPAWGTVLPEDSVWRLVAYIRSLRTPDEPEPPAP